MESTKSMVMSSRPSVLAGHLTHTRWLTVLCIVLAVGAQRPAAHVPATTTQVISGTLKTADGSAVSDAAVVLVTGAADAGAAAATIQCVDVVDGAFALAAVPPGEYRVAVTADCADAPPATDIARRGVPVRLTPDGGLTTIHFVVATEPQLRVVSASVTAAVRMGGPPGAALPPGAPRPPSMPAAPGRGAPGAPVPRPGAISGRLTDMDGIPLAGVTVQAARRPSTNPTTGLMPFGQAVTAEDGTYRILNVPDTEVIVIALALRSQPGAIETVSAIPSVAETDDRRVGFLTTYFPSVGNAARARPIRIAGAEVGGIDFSMRRGLVTRVSGRLLGDSPLPMAGGLAVLLPQAFIEHVGGRNVHRVRIGSEGFVFDDVPAGVYTLTANAPAGWARETVRVGDDGRPIEMDVTLQPPLAISGSVQLEAERVAVDAAVLGEIQVELRPVPRTTGSPLLRVPVSADGTFRFPRVPGDRYSLTVAPPTFWVPIAGTIGGRDTLDFPIDLRESASDALLVLADRDTNLRGTVRALDGQPITAARVVVYSEDRQYWINGATRRVRVFAVGPGGAYGASGLPPGDYLARAFPPDARLTNTVLETSRATATRFSLGIGESRVVDLLLVK
jgi:hypothetical protein